MNGRKITTFLLGLSLLSTVGGSLYIGSFRNKVTVTQNILHGEPSVVEGLNLNLSSYLAKDLPYSLDMQMLVDQGGDEHSWEIQIPLSEPENSLTTYSFQKERTDFYWQNMFYFTPYVNIHQTFIWQRTDDEMQLHFLEKEDIFSLEQELHNLAERAIKEGQTFLSETYPVSDFFEEYPNYTSVAIHMNEKEYYELAEESAQQMRDLFGSAVHPEHLITLDVSLEDGGYVNGRVGYSTSNRSGIESHCTGLAGEGYFTYQLVNTVYDDAQNLISRNSDALAKIYYISLVPVDDRDFSPLEIESLVEIGSLPEHQRIASMTLTKEGNMALLTEDMNTQLLSLDFYDLTTFTLLDSFPLVSSEGCIFYQVYQYSEGISVTIYQDDVRIVWVFKENQGDYQPFLEELPVSVIDYLEDTDYIRTYATVMDFINDKLVVVHLIQQGDYLDYYPLVGVFDETGLIYLSEYHHSQNLTTEQFVHKSNIVKLNPSPSFSSVT